MEQTMRVIALAALAVVVASGSVRAATVEARMYQEAATVLARFTPKSLPDRGGDLQLVPHAGIDPGMTISPPRVGARMPVIEPPGTLDPGE
jgi:hypothetical protein